MMAPTDSPVGDLPVRRNAARGRSPKHPACYADEAPVVVAGALPVEKAP